MNPIVDSIVRDGMQETWLRVLHRTRLISCLHTFEFYIKTLADTNASQFYDWSREPLSNGIQLICREIQEGELSFLKWAPEMYSSETLREHFNRGMRFFGAFHDNAVVALNGFHPQYAHLGYIGWPLVQLPKGVAYINCVITAPDYRQCGAGSRLSLFCWGVLKQEGFWMVAAAVFIENKAARAWHNKQGFQRWGRVSYIKRGAKGYWKTRLTAEGRKHATLLNHKVQLKDI